MTRSSSSLWERWDEIDRLFAAALERPPEERRVLLQQECGGDEVLIDLVAGLLRAEEGSAGLFERPEGFVSRDFLEDLAGRSVIHVAC